MADEETYKRYQELSKRWGSWEQMEHEKRRIKWLLYRSIDMPEHIRQEIIDFIDYLDNCINA